MADFTHVFDIDTLGEELGGEVTEQLGPGGRMMKAVTWSPELVKKLCEHLKSSLAGAETPEINQCGSAPMWVMAAANSAMYPAPVTFAPPQLGAELKIHRLEQGELNPAAEVKFKVVREGKTVFITYQGDDPDKPGTYGGGLAHNYNMDLLPLVKTPAVGDDEHVCLGGNSAFNVTLSIATAYFDGCASLSMLNAGFGFAGSEYTCAVTRSGERKLGNVTPVR